MTRTEVPLSGDPVSSNRPTLREAIAKLPDPRKTKIKISYRTEGKKCFVLLPSTEELEILPQTDNTISLSAEQEVAIRQRYAKTGLDPNDPFIEQAYHVVRTLATKRYGWQFHQAVLRAKR